MNYKLLGIVSLISLLLGLGVGKYFMPPKVITKSEIQVVNKEVIKKDVVTVTKIVEKKDGTKETVIVETDKSESNKTDTSISKVETKTVNKPDWKFDVTARNDSFNSAGVVYGIIVNRRILGPISIGLGVDTSKSALISVGIEF